MPVDGKPGQGPRGELTPEERAALEKRSNELGRKLGSPTPLAAAANELMNACRGLGIDHNDFVVAHQVYRRLGGAKS